MRRRSARPAERVTHRDRRAGRPRAGARTGSPDFGEPFFSFVAWPPRGLRAVFGVCYRRWSVATHTHDAATLTAAPSAQTPNQPACAYAIVEAIAPSPLPAE